LIGLAVDEEISRQYDKYPAPPIVEHLRKLRPLIQYRMDRQQIRETGRTQAEAELEDSPF